MPRRLRLAPEALEDIEHHRAWLTQPGSGKKARRTLSAIVRAIQDLPTAPLRWARSTDHPGYRTRIVEGYVVIYRLEPDSDDPTAIGDVLVVRVFAPRQDRSGLT